MKLGLVLSSLVSVVALVIGVWSMGETMTFWISLSLFSFAITTFILVYNGKD